MNIETVYIKEEVDDKESLHNSVQNVDCWNETQQFLQLNTHGTAKEEVKQPLVDIKLDTALKLIKQEREANFTKIEPLITEELDIKDNIEIGPSNSVVAVNETSPPAPKKRRVTYFSVKEKEAIFNIFNMCQQLHPKYLKIELVNATAQAAGIGEASVYKILREYKNHQVFQPPKTNYPRFRSVLDGIGAQTKCSIRHIIHSTILRNELPTVQTILKIIKEKNTVPNFKPTSFKKLLREIGFGFTKVNRNSVAKEKDEIIAWRRRYLRQIKTFRQQNKKFYYLGETWVNTDHAVGVKESSGKERRLIILHIGSDEGFVENGLHFFESKKTYHENTYSQVFEQWFKEILLNLAEDCVIILDNTSFHARKVETFPRSSAKKPEIQNWLQNKNIAYEEDMVKAELLDLVKQNKPETKYIIEELAKANNRTVVWLPPFHYDLHAIEDIWNHIKGEIVKKNAKFKLADAQNLFREAVNNTSPQIWKDAIEQVLKVEEYMWHLDDVMEKQIEALIRPDDSSSSETDYSE